MFTKMLMQRYTITCLHNWYDPTVAARDTVLGWRRESTLMQKYKNSRVDDLDDNDE